MRVARWRWVLVPMIVVVAGCLPHTTALPASFLDTFSGTNGNPVFTAQPQPAGTGQDIVARLRVSEPMFRGRAVPVFGTIDCQGTDCRPLLEVRPGVPLVRTVWVVLYPDCSDGKDIGWVLVDPAQGNGGAYVTNTPCGP